MLTGRPPGQPGPFTPALGRAATEELKASEGMLVEQPPACPSTPGRLHVLATS